MGLAGVNRPPLLVVPLPTAAGLGQSCLVGPWAPGSQGTPDGDGSGAE